MSKVDYKQKFKVGQMVWYIANGYVTNERIRGVFVDKHDCVNYSTSTPEYGEGKYSYDYSDVLDESSLYSSKRELIKSIQEQEDNE